MMKTIRNTLILSILLAAAGCTSNQTPVSDTNNSVARKIPDTAELHDAERALLNKDYATAYKLLLPLARIGFPSARNNLGTLYERGLGVKRDYAQAHYWYKQAGIPAAYYNLGNLYATGKGVPADFKKAFRHHLHAAEQGDADAQNEVGVMYSKGKGTVKNERAARMWYERAAAQGHTLGQYNLANSLANGTGGAKDEAHALTLFRVAAAKGDAEAYNMLGVIYYEGRLGQKQDTTEARKWWKKGAAAGSSNARNHLEQLNRAK